jgi:predicted RNA-binding Zn ribbon-like protein
MHVYAEVMSVMEKRLQLLLDAHRYELVSDEATRSGRSVASVIREAIDVRFEQAEAQARRSAALHDFLDLVAEHPGPDEDWRTIKARLDEELESQIDKKVGQRR